MSTATAVMSNPAEAQEDPRDSRYYTYPPTGQLLDRVTTIIGGTDSKPWKPKWYGATAAAWCVDHIEAIARAKVLEGRKAAIDLGKDEAERLRSVKADAGTVVHDYLEALILCAASRDGEGSSIAIPLPLLPEHLEDAWYEYDIETDEGVLVRDVVVWMVDGFMDWVSAFNPRFISTEMPVYNQPLGYAGTLDMIIELDGYAISEGTGPKGADEVIASPGSVLRVCVDAKTGKAMEGTWKEQLAAYRRAPECQPAKIEGIHPTPATDCGAVLHLRPSYPGGWLFTLVSTREDEDAWERFTKAASIYRDRQHVAAKPGPAIRPLRADGTMPPPRLFEIAGEGYGGILAPLSAALGADAELSQVARFTAAEIVNTKGKGVKGIGPKRIGVIREMLKDYGLALAGEELPPQGVAA
jgi:hypothetical protein